MDGGRRRAARLAAPLAFLLAATIGILLIRSALHHEAEPGPTTVPTVTAPATTAVTTGATTATTPASRFYVVREGDTLETIAEQEGTSVERLLELNPGVDPVALSIGQRIRVG